MIVMVSPNVQIHALWVNTMSKDGLFPVGEACRDVFLAGLGPAVAAGRPLVASATRRRQNFPAFGTPLGNAATHQDQVNADLLVFIHDHASSATPRMSQ